ncbi:uncharacterized protein LOC106373372 [Brassica napus]|uniref:uncharacterized protein LOC106373372 n=1 Tax=Brassica napus TaxID=3708 RepID=UPI0006AAEED1|nr:uncharacterized protein LOC106373372 [Brassica napus]
MYVSEAQSQDYPPRLYPEGSSNLEGKNINHSFHLGEFHHVREAIGRDVLEQEKSPIGVIAKLAARKSVWSAFSEEFNLPLGMGPKLDELKPALEVCQSWSFGKRKWLGLLLLQATRLYALHHNSRIPFESAKRVFDNEAMMLYPWGRTAYEVLVDSIKMLDPQGGSYTISGMKDVLMGWVYESVTCFEEQFGRVVNSEDIPLLRWGGKRTRASFTKLSSEEIKDHGEVRVRKMIMKDSVEEMFSQWMSEDDDPQLINLITYTHGEDLDKASEVKKTLVDEFGSAIATRAKSAATPAKAAATPEAKVAATADKDAALDSIIVSPAKGAKDAKAGKEGGRMGNPKQKDDEAVLTKKEAAAKKREEAALKRKGATEKKNMMS